MVHDIQTTLNVHPNLGGVASKHCKCFQHCFLQDYILGGMCCTWVVVSAHTFHRFFLCSPVPFFIQSPLFLEQSIYYLILHWYPSKGSFGWFYFCCGLFLCTSQLNNLLPILFVSFLLQMTPTSLCLLHIFFKFFIIFLLS